MFSLPRVVPCFPLLGLTPSGLFMGLSSTIIYTSELILCSTICVPSATRHNIHMYPYFNCVTPVELNELLRKFYAEVTSEKGQPLTQSTLTGSRAAIHRQLTSAPISRSMNIMQDSEFLSANKMFEAKCKLYTKEMNPKPTHKSLIAAGDMLKLRGYFSEGLDSNNSWADPERLLQFV